MTELDRQRRELVRSNMMLNAPSLTVEEADRVVKQAESRQMTFRSRDTVTDMVQFRTDDDPGDLRMFAYTNVAVTDNLPKVKEVMVNEQSPEARTIETEKFMLIKYPDKSTTAVVHLTAPMVVYANIRSASGEVFLLITDKEHNMKAAELLAARIKSNTLEGTLL